MAFPYMCLCTFSFPHFLPPNPPAMSLGFHWLGPLLLLN